MMDGIINILKPPGMSSHDVVKYIRNLTKEKKVGHTGTLDPGAAGVLPICLGGATKLSSLLINADKQYIAEMILGVETDSLDAQGKVVSVKEFWEELNEQSINRAFESFLGEIYQIPPMVSALKLNGRKLYELAKNGKTVERQPRLVKINELRLLAYGKKLDRLTGEYLPYIRFMINCSKGTYIRTLCSDLGFFWDSCAYMSFLVRTRTGNFKIEESYTLEEIKKAAEKEEIEQLIISVELAFANLPQIIITDQAMPMLKSGNWLFPPDLDNPVHLASSNLEGEVRISAKNGQFLGIYKYESNYENLKKQPRVKKYGYKSALRPIKVFC